ncbi:CDP-alcohol phosphatidyltransferase family protein [Kineococcus arenarius]|uniref:CDP-alcohol phosphatidyltransferase family protein n=1 Tax=Kineococcus sp. SYSU DK007 TaxID=3383128 RepID=UPI003D7E2FD6
MPFSRTAPHPAPRTAAPGVAEPWTTTANAVTAVRTAVAVALGCAAAATGSPALLLVAYLAYWVGDVLDGAVARLMDQETRQGAVLDILSDRACTAVLLTTYLGWHPSIAVPAAVFLLQFMVVDCLLSLAFLRWPLVSPNHFHLVDRRVWLWNWSKPAKALNTSGVVACLVLGFEGAATAVAVAVLAVKCLSAVRVARLSRAPR